MNARWPLLVPLSVAIAHGACTFPEVALDETGAGTSSSADTTTQGPGPASSGSSASSTSTTTTTTGDGGGGGTSVASAGGADGGGGSGGEGGSGGGTTGPGGSGFCPVTGCQYLDDPLGNGGAGGAPGSGGDGGSVLDEDCDGDGDPNGTDCQPCDERVHHGLDEDTYFVEPYDKLGGGQSFDYNCENGGEYDFDGPRTCGSFLISTCPVAVYTVQPQCGEFRSRQSCAVDLGLCVDSGPAADQQVGCH